jgi:outer membrane protein assembly factor BamB
VWERRLPFDSVEAFWPQRGRLYLDGTLARCLSAATGETLVEKDFGARLSSYGVIGSGPVYFIEERGAILCLDPRTLEERWRWDDPSGIAYVHDDRICRYEQDGTMELVEIPDRIVRRQVKGPPRPGFGTSHGHVGDLWGQMYDLLRMGFDVRSGQVAWMKEEKDRGYHHLAEVVGEMAYCGERGLSAYDLRSGELVWRQTFGKAAPWLSCLPRLEGDFLYGGTKTGLVFVVDRWSGEVAFSLGVNFAPMVVTPLSPDQIVVGAHDEILCFGRS